MLRKNTIENARNHFASMGIILLAKLYVNRTTKMPYRCIRCNFEHECTLSSLMTTNPKALSSRKSGCKRCSYENRNGLKKDIEKVRQAFSESGLNLLETEYLKANQGLKFICNSCGYSGKINWNNFQQGGGCQNCNRKLAATKRKNDKRTLTEQEFSSRLLRNNLIFIGRKGKSVEYKCTICDYEGWTHISNTNRNKGCWRCGVNCRVSARKLKFDEVYARLKQKQLTLFIHGGKWFYTCDVCSHVDMATNHTISHQSGCNGVCRDNKISQVVLRNKKQWKEADLDQDLNQLILTRRAKLEA